MLSVLDMRSIKKSIGVVDGSFALKLLSSYGFTAAEPLEHAELTFLEAASHEGEPSEGGSTVHVHSEHNEVRYNINVLLRILLPGQEGVGRAVKALNSFSAPGSILEKAGKPLEEKRLLEGAASETGRGETGEALGTAGYLPSGKPGKAGKKGKRNKKAQKRAAESKNHTEVRETAGYGNKGNGPGYLQQYPGYLRFIRELYLQKVYGSERRYSAENGHISGEIASIHSAGPDGAAGNGAVQGGVRIGEPGDGELASGAKSGPHRRHAWNGRVGSTGAYISQKNIIKLVSLSNGMGTVYAGRQELQTVYLQDGYYSEMLFREERGADTAGKSEGRPGINGSEAYGVVNPLRLSMGAAGEYALVLGAGRVKELLRTAMKLNPGKVPYGAGSTGGRGFAVERQYGEFSVTSGDTFEPEYIYRVNVTDAPASLEKAGAWNGAPGGRGGAEFYRNMSERYYSTVGLRRDTALAVLRAWHIKSVLRACFLELDRAYSKTGNLGAREDIGKTYGSPGAGRSAAAFGVSIIDRLYTVIKDRLAGKPPEGYESLASAEQAFMLYREDAQDNGGNTGVYAAGAKGLKAASASAQGKSGDEGLIPGIGLNAGGIKFFNPAQASLPENSAANGQDLEDASKASPAESLDVFGYAAGAETGAVTAGSRMADTRGSFGIGSVGGRAGAMWSEKLKSIALSPVYIPAEDALRYGWDAAESLYGGMLFSQEYADLQVRRSWASGEKLQERQHGQKGPTGSAADVRSLRTLLYGYKGHDIPGGQAFEAIKSRSFSFQGNRIKLRAADAAQEIIKTGIRRAMTLLTAAAPWKLSTSRIGRQGNDIDYHTNPYVAGAAQEIVKTGVLSATTPQNLSIPGIERQEYDINYHTNPYTAGAVQEFAKTGVRRAVTLPAATTPQNLRSHMIGGRGVNTYSGVTARIPVLSELELKTAPESAGELLKDTKGLTRDNTYNPHDYSGQLSPVGYMEYFMRAGAKKEEYPEQKTAGTGGRPQDILSRSPVKSLKSLSGKILGNAGALRPAVSGEGAGRFEFPGVPETVLVHEGDSSASHGEAFTRTMPENSTNTRTARQAYAAYPGAGEQQRSFYGLIELFDAYRQKNTAGGGQRGMLEALGGFRGIKLLKEILKVSGAKVNRTASVHYGGWSGTGKTAVLYGTEHRIQADGGKSVDYRVRPLAGAQPIKPVTAADGEKQAGYGGEADYGSVQGEIVLRNLPGSGTAEGKTEGREENNSISFETEKATPNVRVINESVEESAEFDKSDYRGKMPDISKLADQVYKKLEERLRVERQRRGLFR